MSHLKLWAQKNFKHTYINMYLHTAFVRNEINFLQFEVDLKVIGTKYYKKFSEVVRKVSFMAV